MKQQTQDAVRQVLKDAAETQHFFGLSDAERLMQMLCMAFDRGRKSVTRKRRRKTTIRARRP